MDIDNARYERYAMRIEEISKTTSNIAGIDFMAVGKDLGYAQNEIQEIVDLMASENWVVLFPEIYPNRLRLTGPGKRAIARLHYSKLRRWWNDNYLAVIGIVLAFIAILIALRN